ncbi:MAG: alternative ribosome rescue aminoacyl-tRNA hydrolase ArfB [Acidimicrobiia bacterium]|nr:alternative ribosome rescue aminoacyl-tRNA hydrolase ArfB [Acidimicrobiia bacterium]
MDDLQVTPDHFIPANELEWRFDTSGGPGGQHANKAATRVELRFDLGRSEVFPADMRRHMLDQLGSRVRDGVVTVSVDESRSQYRNRVTARRRLAELLAESMRMPTARRPTRPSRAAKRRRSEAKRRRSETKRLRRRPELD